MSDIKARIFSEDNILIEKLENLLKEQSFEFQIHNNWTQLLSSGETSCFIIDQEIIKEEDKMSFPRGSVVIGLISSESFDDVRKWMAVGADHVIVVPEELDELKKIIEEVKEKLQYSQSEFKEEGEYGNGRVSAFFSTKGGSGKTIISAMAAQCFQLQHDQRVVIIDLNAQFGGMEVVMGLEPSRTYYDLEPVVEEMNIHHIQNVVQTDQETGVQVLLGPADPEKAEHMNEQLVPRLIQTCRSHFDHIILDVPSGLNTFSFTGLNEASQIYYLMSPDSLSLRGYKEALRIFERFRFAGQEKLSLVLNWKHRKTELTEKGIERLVDKPITSTIRSGFFHLQPFLNMGSPFFNKKGKPLCGPAQDVAKLVEKTI